MILCVCLCVCLQAFYYPADAGLPMGGPGSSRFLRLEVHYHNPLLISGTYITHVNTRALTFTLLSTHTESSTELSQNTFWSCHYPLCHSCLWFSFLCHQTVSCITIFAFSTDPSGIRVSVMCHLISSFRHQFKICDTKSRASKIAALWPIWTCLRWGILCLNSRFNNTEMTGALIESLYPFQYPISPLNISWTLLGFTYFTGKFFFLNELKSYNAAFILWEINAKWFKVLQHVCWPGPDKVTDICYTSENNMKL